MDELKLNLETNFIRSLISKIIRKSIKKKIGSDLDILINQITIKSVDGKVHMHFDADAEITTQELMKLIKTIGLN